MLVSNLRIFSKIIKFSGFEERPWTRDAGAGFSKKMVMFFAGTGGFCWKMAKAVLGKCSFSKKMVNSWGFWQLVLGRIGDGVGGRLLAACAGRGPGVREGEEPSLTLGFLYGVSGMESPSQIELLQGIVRYMFGMSTFFWGNWSWGIGGR